MNAYCMARRVLTDEVSGGRVSGIPRLGWMDVVNVSLGSRGLTVEVSRPSEIKISKSGEPWCICR